MGFIFGLVGEVLTGIINETVENVQKMERQTGQRISAENREIFDIMDDLSRANNNYRKTAFQNTAPDENGLYTCNGCGRKFTRDEMDADHIIPKSRGGSNSRKNMQLLCKHCNRSKQNSTDKTYIDLARREMEIEQQNAEDAAFLDNMRKGRR